MFSHPVTEGLELRLLQEFDAEALFTLVNRNREYLRKWLPWVDATNTPFDISRYIAGALERFARGEGFVAGLWYRDRLAGTIDLYQISWANRTASIGYWLSEEHQGKGLMTAACRAVIRHAFEILRLNRLEIRCGTGNTKSCAIPERLGFRREGLLRQAEWVSGRFVDLYVYGLLASERPRE